MKITVVAALALVILPWGRVAAGEADPLCKPMRAFVASVGPDETRELAFHTSWGANFKTSAEPAIFAKQCEHHGYPPAAAACQVLMARGAVEFSSTNAQRTITCLSPDNRWGRHVSLQAGSVSLRFGSENRGSHVLVSYAEDPEMGGMVLRVVADGY